MRIERAGTDFLSFDQFRSREFLGLSLVWKCFSRPCAPSLSRLLFECDVPRALGFISHETLARGGPSANDPIYFFVASPRGNGIIKPTFPAAISHRHRSAP